MKQFVFIINNEYSFCHILPAQQPTSRVVEKTPPPVVTSLFQSSGLNASSSVTRQTATNKIKLIFSALFNDFVAGLILPKSATWWTNTARSLLTAYDTLGSCSRSSVVEHAPFKRVAVGSSPTVGI